MSEPAAGAWEPWTPKVGQKVTIRLSGECRQEFQARGRNGETHPVPLSGHFDEENGQVGKITQILSGNSHRFVVTFDADIFIVREGRSGWSWGGCYAAAELEPIGTFAELALLDETPS